MVFTLAHRVKRQGTRASVVYMLNELGNRSQTGCSHICFLLSPFFQSAKALGYISTFSYSSCVVELVTKTLMLTILLCAWHGGRTMLVNCNRNQRSQIEILSKCTTLPVAICFALPTIFLDINGIDGAAPLLNSSLLGVVRHPALGA